MTPGLTHVASAPGDLTLDDINTRGGFDISTRSGWLPTDCKSDVFPLSCKRSGLNGLELVRDLGVWFVGVLWPESSMIRLGDGQHNFLIHTHTCTYMELYRRVPIPIKVLPTIIIT